MAGHYRGRIAPTPTGYLHLGHARTFSIAMQRAADHHGTLLFRNEDLDPQRCKQEYIDASMEDLKACGLTWQEGPQIGGKYGPYNQSERLNWFTDVWSQLKEAGVIYPCNKSRKDVQNALTAPHAEDIEAIFPVLFRPEPKTGLDANEPGQSNWRFRVPDGERISFIDKHYGEQSFTAGTDFGDFLVWRKDGFPAYELAVVADDHAMQISEVVRGEDLLLSTARQVLIYNALNWPIPDFYHCDLMLDENGQRLAKRHKSLSLKIIHQTGQWDNYKLLLKSR